MFSSNQNSRINTGRGDLDLFLKTNRGELSGTTNRAIDESSDSLSRTKNISPVKTPVSLWFPSGITPLDSSASSLFLSDTFPTEELFNPQVLKEATLKQQQTEAHHVSEIEKSGPEVDRKSHEQQVKPKYANVKLDEYMKNVSVSDRSLSDLTVSSVFERNAPHPVAEVAAEQGKLLMAKRMIEASDHPDLLYIQGIEEFEGLSENVSSKSKKNEIKAHYKSIEKSEFKIKKIEGEGANEVKIIEIETSWGFSDTVILKDTKTDQQARQVDFAGKHGRFFEGANIVGASHLFDKTVLSMNVDNLKTGEEAINQIDLNSESTQHTALASLSLQMLDLHESNIGINSDKEFLLFDTDHLMFENNNYFEAVDLDGELRANSPLGHNYLQTLDIKIEDFVFEEHLKQLNDLIDFELSGMNQGLTPEQGRKIHSILYENLSRDDNLSLFGKYNNQFTESQRDHRDRYSINIDIIKKNFSRKLKRNRALENKIVHELKRNGIPTDIIKKFRREPAILHPKNTTLRQMEALRSREENLSGLLLLREVLSSRENSTKDKKNAIRAHIMSLPSNTKTKINVLTDLATGGRDAQKAIRKVGGMVSGELSFNKLVRAAYPTTSRLFDYYKGEPDITDVLTWENSDEYSEVLLTETDRVNRLKAKL